MKAIEEHIESIISRKLEGNISTEEEKILAAWLSESPDNSDYYQDLEKIYAIAGTGKSDSLPAIDIDQEWQKFQASVSIPTVVSGKNNFWLKIAASVVIIATVGYLVWFNSTSSNLIEVVAQESGQVIILPDSSEVTLNKGASFSYPKKYKKKQRLVSLTGEAFFDIKSNPKQPFKVDMGLSEVEVLGTSFNINAKQDNEAVEVVVTTGKVKFSNKNKGESVILLKGEKGIIMKTNGVLAKTQNKDLNYMAWKTRKIVFNDISLDEVIKTLNRIYEQQVFFSTEVDPNCKVTVTFENQSIEAILSVLEVTHNLEYTKSGDIIEVVKTGC